MSRDWAPTADIATLRQRANIISEIRDFFKARDVLEVETPLLSRGVATDPHLKAFCCDVLLPGDKKLTPFYLQTSPEYAMKRLLAAGTGSIYQISKAFRSEESGVLHNPEFTMLEWYRVGFNHHDLMDEMDGLLQRVLGCLPAQRLSYQAMFLHYAGFDPHQVSCEYLQTVSQQHQWPAEYLSQADKDQWLDHIFHYGIEPQLQGVFFMYDYPKSQALLSRIREGSPPIAERFEVYVNGVELANGFHECCDADEQRERMQADNHKRALLNRDILPIDENFLAALQSGLPACAGVALGVDRLIQMALQKSTLVETISFSIASA